MSTRPGRTLVPTRREAVGSAPVRPPTSRTRRPPHPPSGGRRSASRQADTLSPVVSRRITLRGTVKPRRLTQRNRQEKPRNYLYNTFGACGGEIFHRPRMSHGGAVPLTQDRKGHAMTPVPPATALAAPEPPTRPLVVTDSQTLLDDLLRLADIAGVTIDAVSGGRLARRYWSDAPLVVVGPEAARGCIAACLPHRRNVVLVGGDMDDGRVWDLATAIGAEHVVFLPDAEIWLVDLFACLGTPHRRHATVVGVLGGRGGAGATCLAVAIALAGLRRRLRTVLVDADPNGGGIDLALGAEHLPGLRWPDVVKAAERTPHRLLADALPSVDELTVLSWNRAGASLISPNAMSTLLTTARCGSELIAVDLPRSVDEAAAAALQMCRMTLLVVPAEVRATAAAMRVREAAQAHCPDVRVVVRVPGPGGLAARAVADAVGAPLGGVLRSENGLAQALERGEPPGSRRRGPLARFSARLLTSIDFDAEDAAA